MYLIKRKTTEPASAIKIMVDRPQVDDPDGGFTAGGSFYFYPAGSEDGSSSHQVGDVAAAAIMGDPGVAKHFECIPPWKPKPAPVAPKTEVAPQAATKPAATK